MIVVLDASAGVRLVVPGQAVGDEAVRVIEEADRVVVPSLYGPEVANALWKYVTHNQIGPGDAVEMLQAALALADEVVETDLFLLAEALAEAGRFGHPVYDMVYVVLARHLGARLMTCDHRLARAAQILGTGVIFCTRGGETVGTVLFVSVLRQTEPTLLCLSTCGVG